jgi:hypothetical protein
MRMIAWVGFFFCASLSEETVPTEISGEGIPARPSARGEDATVVASQSVFLRESRAYGHDCYASGIRYLNGKNSISRPRG